MRRTYYKILSNDGCPQSDEISSIRAARKELKDLIAFDANELGLKEGEIEYYIEKYIETEDTIYHDRV